MPSYEFLARVALVSPWIAQEIAAERARAMQRLGVLFGTSRCEPRVARSLPGPDPRDLALDALVDE